MLLAADLNAFPLSETNLRTWETSSCHESFKVPDEGISHYKYQEQPLCV